jgi:hypothetical protein
MKFRSLMSVVAVVLFAACSDATGSDSIAGTYALRTVNGDAVPTVIFESGGITQEILDGSIRLGQDGSSSITYRVRFDSGDGVPSTETYSASGAYVRSGSIVSFTFLDDGDLLTGVAELEGKTLILIDDVGDEYVFRR